MFDAAWGWPRILKTPRVPTKIIRQADEMIVHGEKLQPRQYCGWQQQGMLK